MPLVILAVLLLKLRAPPICDEAPNRGDDGCHAVASAPPPRSRRWMPRARGRAQPWAAASRCPALGTGVRRNARAHNQGCGRLALLSTDTHCAIARPRIRTSIRSVPNGKAGESTSVFETVGAKQPPRGRGGRRFSFPKPLEALRGLACAGFTGALPRYRYRCSCQWSCQFHGALGPRWPRWWVCSPGTSIYL